MYRDMDADAMLAWGAEESRLRQADLAGARSAEGLKTAQANAERRRQAIDATIGQASDMVICANRDARIRTARQTA